jgi:hypothetical protein
VLRFTPTAWAQLLFLRDRGPTEIGGFGIVGDDPFCVEEIGVIKQLATPVTVQFDDEAVADFFDEQIDRGRRPEQFGRIWVHTHPADSAEPSGTDEATFARCFGRTDWAVMFILARGGETYARLRFHLGPGGDLLIPVEVDFTVPFPAADRAAWEQEFEERITPADQCFPNRGPLVPDDLIADDSSAAAPFEWSPSPDFWDDDRWGW